MRCSAQDGPTRARLPVVDGRVQLTLADPAGEACEVGAGLGLVTGEADAGDADTETEEGEAAGLEAGVWAHAAISRTASSAARLLTETATIIPA